MFSETGALCLVEATQYPAHTTVTSMQKVFAPKTAMSHFYSKLPNPICGAVCCVCDQVHFLAAFAPNLHNRQEPQIFYKIQVFSHWYPPKKLKYGQPRVGESTLM